MIRAIQCSTVMAWAVLGLAPLAVTAATKQEVPSLAMQPGMSLESALAALNAHGYRIVYSNALVLSEMRLLEAPRATRIDDLLREILTPWNLAAINDANGDWLIVKSKTRAAVPATPPAAATAETLEIIDVTASRFGLATSAGSSVFLDRKDVERIPHLGDDSVRMLKLLPGVTGGDYSAQLNIRGGRRDETMLVIDGVEIHNGFHFRDLDSALSVLDTHLVQGIDFITGGMTADYGDYMSGVVDLTTFQPRPEDETRSMLGISFVSAYGRTGGNFAEGRGSWLVAARRGYLDLVLKHSQSDDERLTPRFSDVFASVKYDFSADTSLSAHALLGDDDLVLISHSDDPVDSAGTGQSGHFWVTLDHAFNDAWRARTLLTVASMEQTRDSTGTELDERDGTVLGDFDFSFLDFRQDWSWNASDSHLMRFGFNAGRHEASYDYHLVGHVINPSVPNGVIDILRDTDMDVTGTRIGAYGSWRSRLTDALTVEAGARWDTFQYPGDLSFEEVSPRINVVYAIGASGELRAAWSVVHQPQGIDALQVEDGITDFFGPERSVQSVLSYTHRFARGISARMDVYNKEYSNLRPRFENALDSFELIPEASIDRIRIDAAEAEARGVEVSVRREADRGFAGWAAASFARARDLVSGKWVSRSWEQELTFSFGTSWTGELWSFNLAGLYHTGAPTTTLSSAMVPGPEGDVAVVVPGAWNAARLGPYMRFDLRVNRDVRIRSGRFSYYLEVMNLLDAENPCCIEDFRLNPRNTSEVLVEESYWLPRLPSLGFQWEF
ncbi:MAG TPA: TonB-dependent receptor [Povalibacter sp.]